MKALAAALLLLFPATALAQEQASAEAQQVCAPGWNDSAKHTAAKSVADLPSATLAQGGAIALALHSVSEVRFAATPERAPTAFGGMAMLTIAQAGAYRIGLSSGAWIDVLHDGKPVPSTAHGHGEACIRKQVSFALQPGVYVIQLSGNPEPVIRIMVTR